MEAEYEQQNETSHAPDLGTHILATLNMHKGRIAAFCFLVYLLDLVRVGSAGGWSLEDGFQWSSPGYQLFPIPINWYDFGFGFEQVVVPMPLADIVLYSIFIGYYFWLVWGALTITYIIYPPSIGRMKDLISKGLNRSP